MRSAAAAGAAGVMFSGGNRWIAHNPKVVRASGGAVFAVRIVEGTTAVKMLDALGAARTTPPRRPSPPAARHLERVDLTGPVAIVLGNEASGIPGELGRTSTGRSRIPMNRAPSRSTSRWRAPCSLFEAARQRRAAR